MAMKLHPLHIVMKILMAASANHDEDDKSVISAVSFPWPAGSEIHVLSVAEAIHPVMVGMVPDIIDPTELQVNTDAEAQTAAIRAAGRFRNRGFATEAFNIEGDPETAILEHARKWGADLIVVGSHDRTRVEKFLVGSISEGVAKHAPCSVLMLKLH